MRLWKVVCLVNLALAIGLGIGYGVWGRRVATLDGEIGRLQEQVGTLQRERDALAAGAKEGLQRWEGLGVVLGSYPQLIVLMHEAIDTFPARTTGFRIAPSVDRGSMKVGDTIRFWLHGTAPGDSTVVALEPL
jgi:hypothetical protein